MRTRYPDALLLPRISPVFKAAKPEFGGNVDQRDAAKADLDQALMAETIDAARQGMNRYVERWRETDPRLKDLPPWIWDALDPWFALPVATRLVLRTIDNDCEKDWWALWGLQQERGFVTGDRVALGVLYGELSPLLRRKRPIRHWRAFREALGRDIEIAAAV